MIKVAIVGAGRGGSELLRVFHTNGEVRIVGINDKRRDAPGLELAKQWNIFIAEDVKGLYEQKPDIIINTTGDPLVGEAIKADAPYHIEVIEGTSARFLWELVKRQQEARGDLSAMYQNGILITKAESLHQAMDEILKTATRITGTPAGSIALKDNDEMVMIAQRGLSPEFFKQKRWRPRAQGLTALILNSTEPVEFDDIDKEPLFEGTNIIKEGIKSLLATPLLLDSTTIGILYLNDFKPRKFTERHKDLIRLFSTFAAQAIEKFKLIHNLDESLSYLESILNDSHDMIVTTDKEGRIVRFSKGGERILGYTEEELRGRKASDLYADPAERTRLLGIIRQRGAVCNYETTLIRKDGSPVEISLTISRLKDRKGNVIGTVGVSKDITEDKRIREELRIKNKELEELTQRLEEKVLERTKELERINNDLKKSNQIKARLIANMSHELKTPLHSIIGFSEVLLEKTSGETDDRQRRYVTNILNSGRHLLQLVNNVLDLARIEAGRLQLSYESFYVDNTIDEVMMVLKPFADKKLISLTTERPHESIELFADKVKFKQILYNLLSNAIKFTPDRGKVGIKVDKVVADDLIPWAPKGKEFIKISVWDTGMGIKEDDQERIFEEFEQVDQSRSVEGVGLGLAMTKKLVELHGGHIDLDSSPGRGSTFSIYLPAVKTDIVKEQAVEPEPYIPISSVTGGEAPLVLVVEDDLPTSELLTLHLTDAGYRVAHAYDGIEAIEKAKSLQPFIISLDVMLPKKNGWEVLQALKSDPDTKDIPVIINSVIDNKELGFALGAADYLVKPVDRETLLGKFKEVSLLSKKRRYPIGILLASDDISTQRDVGSFLEAEGFVVHMAKSKDVLNLAMATRPHLTLIDLDMPNGLEVITQLRENPATKNIPLFALTSSFIPAQDIMMTGGRVERFLKKDALSSKELIRHIRELEMLYPQRAGLIDEITGVFTTRYLYLRLTQEIHRSTRYKIPLILGLIDIDHFGDYVQKNGYYYGNLVLKKVAELIGKNVRGSDVVTRYGGDAFMLILTNTLLPSGMTICKRLISIIHDYPFLNEERVINGRLTASMGITVFEGGSVEELIRSAEKALALAIERGRNRIEVV